MIFIAFALLCFAGYPLALTMPRLDQADAAAIQRSSVALSRARVDRLGGAADAVGQRLVDGAAGGVVHRERCAGVEHHRVAHRPRVTRQQPSYDVRRCAAASPPRRSSAVAGARPNVGRVDGRGGHGPAVDDPDRARSWWSSARRGRRRRGTPRRRRHGRRRPRPSPARARGSAQPMAWAAGRAGLASGPSTLKAVAMPSSRARDGGVAHRGVEGRGEAEGDARPRSATSATRSAGEVEPDAECLEHVGRPGLRGGGPVAVLDDARACAGRDDRRHRGDVDRERAVAAGADDVEQAARAPKIGVITSYIASTSPVSSSMVSPLARSATTKPGDLGGRRLTRRGSPPSPTPPGQASGSPRRRARRGRQARIVLMPGTRAAQQRDDGLGELDRVDRVRHRGVRARPGRQPRVLRPAGENQ